MTGVGHTFRNGLHQSTPVPTKIILNWLGLTIYSASSTTAVFLPVNKHDLQSAVIHPTSCDLFLKMDDSYVSVSVCACVCVCRGISAIDRYKRWWAPDNPSWWWEVAFVVLVLGFSLEESAEVLRSLNNHRRAVQTSSVIQL